MPLPKRLIEPVHLARGTLPEDYPLPSELEAVTNGTLANTVRQLSSLSKHAEDLFGELARDAQQINDRSNSLQARIDRLAIKVTQLDSTVEEVSLQDIHMRKAFKSQVVFDQQIFSRATMPTAMLETYKSCDRPPPLDKLNCYRDDGKDGLKFYTDPNYFFELWRQEILIDTERMMHDRSRKPHRPRQDGGQANRHKKRVRQPHNTRERQKQIAVGHGEYIMPQNTIYRTPPPIQQQQQQQQLMADDYLLDQQRPPRPNSIEIRRSYQQEMPDGGGLHSPTAAGQPPPPLQHHQLQHQPSYEDNPYMQQQQQQQHNNSGGIYGGQGPLSSESLYQQGGTPTRGGKVRPSQPPPAPPSNASTPSANTPTRSRSISSATGGRDALPPPPPPPDTAPLSPPPPPNGLPAHLARSHSQSRSNSPHSHQQTPEPTTAAMAAMAAADLPPPPPAPKQPPAASPPRQQTPVQQAAPPPPPMPPMPLVAGNGGPPAASIVPFGVPLMNGDLAKLIAGSPPKLTPVKDRLVKQLQQQPAPVDPRNDLLKAIRDGIKLRKVEKIEQKELERGNGLHDVASILARRVAVEFSDSESGTDSECDSEGWGENETSA